MDSSSAPHNRTCEEYAALVSLSIKNALPGERPNIPPPQSKAECVVLLKRATEEASKLYDMVSSLFPKSNEEPPLDLSGLTLEEKLALGQKNSDELGAIAYRLAPAKTLDSLERDLPHDARSRDATREVLQRMRQGS